MCVSINYWEITMWKKQEKGIREVIPSYEMCTDIYAHLWISFVFSSLLFFTSLNCMCVSPCVWCVYIYNFLMWLNNIYIFTHTHGGYYQITKETNCKINAPELVFISSSRAVCCVAQLCHIF